MRAPHRRDGEKPSRTGADMESLPINILDLGIVVFFILAALIGLSLGFVRGGLFVVSWTGSMLVTLYGFPYARPYARDLIETPWMADVAAGVAVFLGTLVVFTLISSLIGSWVRDSRLNALDRSLGMLAGILTAGLIVAAVFGAIESVWKPREQPPWMADAKSLPLFREASAALMSLIPKDATSSGTDLLKGIEDKARDALEQEGKDTFQRMLNPRPQGSEGAQGAEGYSDTERKSLERLIEGGNR
ncbi:MAG: CvpA family protein [Rhodospirillales bacterium]|nr:CvpA family protein [Rhodospirillales bacterium]